jgi:hypothetical protein
MKPAPWGDPWDRRTLLGHLLAHHQGRPAADLLDLVSLLALFLMAAGAAISTLAVLAVGLEHLV